MNSDSVAAGTGVPAVPDTGEPVSGGLGGAPVPPPELREAARLAPDHWLTMVDPGWSGEGVPPSWAVTGRWRSGPTGELEEWQENEEHRPSPVFLGWPEATDEVDDAVRLAVTGYGPPEELLRRLAVAELAVPVDAAGRPVAAATPDGIPVVPVFSAVAQLPTWGRLAHEVLPVAELLTRVDSDHRLMLNPAGPACLLLETDALERAVAEAAWQE
ncbi:type VII secretion system-associated protein [Streptomyces sp. NPDC006654]|uniref:type VII secretion system-associated protein n=1 Tax=Streptomyces sp. NPDC006654 TaxID=3156897 RepID=UPI0033E885E0